MILIVAKQNISTSDENPGVVLVSCFIYMKAAQQVFLIFFFLIPCFRVSFALEYDFALRFTKIVSWIIVSFQPTFLF